jgi:hypothetical protein
MRRKATVGVAAFVASQLALTLTAAAQAPASQPTAAPKALKGARTAPAKAAGGAPTDDAATPPVVARAKRDPAEAQRQIDSGIKLLQDGKTEPSIQMLTAGIAGGNLPPAMMGRALLHRGMAYRKVAKPAQAISDLTSALWLKGGLSEADRAEALKQRTEAYREAGLPDQTDADGRVAGVTPRAQRAAAKADAVASAPAVSPAQAPAAQSGVSNFFSNLFGGGTPAPAPVAAALPDTSASASKARAQPQTPPSAVVDGAATPAPRKPGFGTTTIATATPAVAPTAAPAAADGKVRARVALVRTKPEADAVVARLRTQFAEAMAGRQPDVTEASFGGMGTFYQVRVGPYASMTEAGAACARLRGTGLDCVPVDR